MISLWRGHPQNSVIKENQILAGDSYENRFGNFWLLCQKHVGLNNGLGRLRYSIPSFQISYRQKQRVKCQNRKRGPSTTVAEEHRVRGTGAQTNS